MSSLGPSVQDVDKLEQAWEKATKAVRKKAHCIQESEMGWLSLEKAVAVLATVLECLICGYREERWMFLREAPQKNER